MFFGLPDCDKVFMKYFDRWYDPQDRERKIFPATRPDMVVISELKGVTGQQASPLVADAQTEVEKMVQGMLEAARGDWPTYLPVSGPINISWIDEFDRFYDKRRVKDIMKRSDPGDFSNDLLVTCCEFGAVLGDVMIEKMPRLCWMYDWPYWESSVLDTQSGSVISVFHWAIKKFSSNGIDDGFRAKVTLCLESIGSESAGGLS